MILNLDIFLVLWCLVCVMSNLNSFHSYFLNLHNHCSYIEHVHLFVQI